jgi:hypothetical protein
MAKKTHKHGKAHGNYGKTRKDKRGAVVSFTIYLRIPETIHMHLKENAKKEGFLITEYARLVLREAVKSKLAIGFDRDLLDFVQHYAKSEKEYDRFDEHYSLCGKCKEFIRNDVAKCPYCGAKLGWL